MFGLQAGRYFVLKFILDVYKPITKFRMMLEAFSAYHDIRTSDDGSSVQVLLVCIYVMISCGCYLLYV